MRQLCVAIASVAALAAGVAGACSSESDGSGPRPPGDAGDADTVVDTQSNDQVAPDSADEMTPPDAADLPPELAWLVDPAIWKLVDGVSFQNCQLYEALPGKIPLPPLEWKSCGAGCEETSPQQTLGKDLYQPVASTHSVNGQLEVFLAGEQDVNGTLFRYRPRRVIRLRDGVTLGAVKTVFPANVTVSPCSVGGDGESALHTGMTGGKPSAVVELTGPRSPEEGWHIARPPLLHSEAPNSAALILFDTDHQGGQKFAIGKGNVWAQLDVDESAWTLLESNSSSYHGSGEGDLAVWVDFGLDRIRGWADDGLGVRTILSAAPPGTCDVVPTPTHILGYAPETGGDCSSPFKGRIWHIPRSKTLTSVPPTFSPFLPGAPVFLVPSFGIRAWGDFAVVHLHTFDQQPQYLLVVQLSTWKAWRIDAEAGFQIEGGSFTLDDKHIYYGEALKGEALLLNRMRRLTLAELDGAPNVTAP